MQTLLEAGRVMKHFFLCVILISFHSYQSVWTENVGKKSSSPNIIIIMADDLGSNDVSFRGSNQIPTPNIDALAYQGVILNRHYTPALCTPSRATLLTGKYPIHTGTQHSVIGAEEPWGLPLTEKLLPQYLKECAGYKTHMVGKWHLGFAHWKYTPMARGFDSHFGSWGPFITYYSHKYTMFRDPFSSGHDLHRNWNATFEAAGKYYTDVLTDEAIRVIEKHKFRKPLFLLVTHLAPHSTEDPNPLEAPEDEIRKYGYIEDPRRRIYAAMVASLDKSVGKIVSALKDNSLLHNSVILFFSDHGAGTLGMFSTPGSNFPLRGQKFSPWEGAIRGHALIWSPLIERRHRVSEDLFYSGDWLPTLLSLCGGVSAKEIDGMNLWETISRGKISPRREILHNIDPISGYSSYYLNGWKYINGTTSEGIYDGWLGVVPHADRSPTDPSYAGNVMKSPTWKALSPFAQRRLTAGDITELRQRIEIKCATKKGPQVNCDPLKAPCLFHLESDSCEEVNLAQKYPYLVKVLEIRLKTLKAGALPPGNLPRDPRSDPKMWNDSWTAWLDEIPTKSV